MKKILFFFAIIVITIGLSGCQKQVDATTNPGTMEAPLSGTVQMTIKDFKHNPNELVVKSGTILEITNLDSVTQSLTADDGSFDSGNIEKNKTATLNLDQPGEYTFYSVPNPFMTGKVTVIE